MANSGREYEKFIHAIFSAALDIKGLKNVSIQHDVVLPSKTRDAGGAPLKHQIDVYWKFDVANTTYQAIVQAKDWNSRVTKEKVLAFKAVLDDLPGQPRGIMVTRLGYQRGAETFAREHGIELYLLRDLDSAEADVVTSRVGARFDTSFEGIALFFEPTWFEVHGSSVEGILDRVDPNRCAIYSESGDRRGSLRDVLETIRNFAITRDTAELVTHKFPEPVYLREDGSGEEVKLTAIEARFLLRNKTEAPFDVDVARLFTTVITHVTGNREFYVDHENKLHEKSKALCDFCGVPVPDDESNMFETARVLAVFKNPDGTDAGIPQVFEAGRWGGCDTCGELVGAGEREQLYQRAKFFAQRSDPDRPLHGIDAAHNAFWYGYNKSPPVQHHSPGNNDAEARKNDPDAIGPDIL